MSEQGLAAEPDWTFTTTSDGTDAAVSAIEETVMTVAYVAEEEAVVVELSENGEVYTTAFFVTGSSQNLERFTSSWNPLAVLDRIYEEIHEQEDEPHQRTKLDRFFAFSVDAAIITGRVLFFTCKVLYEAGRVMVMVIDEIFTAFDQSQRRQGRGTRRSRPRFTATERDALYRKQRDICRGCNRRFPARNLTVDHILPLARGGTERLSNLQLLCGTCNSVKGDGSQTQLKRRLREQGVILEGVKKGKTLHDGTRARNGLADVI